MRIAVIGGPMCGKSTFASELRSQGYAHYCGDPISKVKRISSGAIYLPDHLEWSEGSEYIAYNWFSLPGPWVIEGVGIVRALRKWLQVSYQAPCDKIVYFKNQYPGVTRLPGQDSMEKAIETVWNEISPNYQHITEFKEWPSENRPIQEKTPYKSNSLPFNFFKA